MTDPIQLLIDAGAIPSTPFVPQSRYYGVPLALLHQRPGDPGTPYVRRRFIPAPQTIATAAAPMTARARAVLGVAARRETSRMASTSPALPHEPRVSRRITSKAAVAAKSTRSGRKTVVTLTPDWIQNGSTYPAAIAKG